MPGSALVHTASQELALALTLEDEFPDLPSLQVTDALRQAGGSLEAARRLCERAAAAPQYQPAGATQPSTWHRQWWPAAVLREAAPPAAPSSSVGKPGGSSTCTSPLLVPHQVSTTLPPARSQQPRGMQPPAAAAARPGAPPPRPAGAAPARRAPAAPAAAAVEGSGGGSSGGSGGGEPHYAAVFLSERSRQQLLQHVAPVHELVSADHMTLAYRPAPEACLALPLGREAQLFVVGAAADYRAQAVAVQHPSWLPFHSDATPHVTVSVGEEVPAREAGAVTATALARPELLTPVARLKLLQGTVGVQLLDGSRVFSHDDLRARLEQQAQQRAVPASAQPAPARILRSGAVAAPAAGGEQGVGAAGKLGAPAPVPPPPVSNSGSSSKAAVWDLDSLMDELHLAAAPSAPDTGGAGAQQPPRRGLLRLPAAVAAEMAPPRPVEDGGPAAAGGGSGARAVRPLVVRRQPAGPPPPPRQQEQPAYDQDAAGWGEPPVTLGKTVAEEAAEAAAGDEPLDLVSSLASLLPTPAAQQQQQQQQQASAGPSREAGGGGVPGAAPGEGAGEAGGSPTWAALSGPVDPEQQRLLQGQFPALHEVVVETALRMHGGSLPAAAQFLGGLEAAAAAAAAAGAGAGGAQRPQQPTLGAFLAAALPEAPPPAPSPAASAASLADSSYELHRPSAAPAAPRAQARLGGRGAGRGAGAKVGPKQRGPGVAGDDPMSVTERQAMTLHLSAKRLYSQSAQEALATGQAALARELQATARAHGEAASAARRRANASAFRSTNAALVNAFSLDLHGQHVDEALASLERYLLTLGGLGHPGGVVLQVITGLGRHSAGNQPRVLPAVVRYLSDAGYKFEGEEDNPGVVNVMIGC